MSVGKLFGQKTDLTNHLKIHTREKPTNAMSAAAFSQKATSTCHQRIHSGEKPYDVMSGCPLKKGNLCVSSEKSY